MQATGWTVYLGEVTNASYIAFTFQNSFDDILSCEKFSSTFIINHKEETSFPHPTPPLQCSVSKYL